MKGEWKFNDELVMKMESTQPDLMKVFSSTVPFASMYYAQMHLQWVTIPRTHLDAKSCV